MLLYKLVSDVTVMIYMLANQAKREFVQLIEVHFWFYSCLIAKMVSSRSSSKVWLYHFGPPFSTTSVVYMIGNNDGLDCEFILNSDIMTKLNMHFGRHIQTSYKVPLLLFSLRNPETACNNFIYWMYWDPSLMCTLSVVASWICIRIVRRQRMTTKNARCLIEITQLLHVIRHLKPNEIGGIRFGRVV